MSKPTDLPQPSPTDSPTSTRRHAIKTGAKAVFGFTVLPSYLATGVRAQGDPQPPSKRINLGCVGTGGRANSVIPSLCRGGNAQPVGFCDVDFGHGNQGKNLQAHPDVKRFADFRVMLEEMGDDIDAVSVVVPDHSHFPATMLAMSMGKHVYVEKPLTHSFQEADLLQKAERKFGVVTQMGNQGHTGMACHQFQRWAERGLCDNVKHIDAWKSGGLWFMNEKSRQSDYLAGQTAPDTLDWDLWCGPAPVRPYNNKLHPFEWRAWYDYGNGMLGDWGCHIIDYVHHYLQLGLPTAVKALRLDDPRDEIFPLTSHLSFTFPERSAKMPEVKLVWRDGADIHPELDERFAEKAEDGSPNLPKLGGAGTWFSPEGADYGILRGSHGGSSRLYPQAEQAKRTDDLRVDPVSADHFGTFVQAAMGEGETWSPFSASAELTKVCMLGCIAQRLGGEFAFDPKAGQFTGGNAAAANALLAPVPRKGWEEFYSMV